jgi:predicted NBD/HSP70 family sugar kinase
MALTTGAPQYTAGQQMPIRVRLRDADGQSVGDAIVEAVLQDQAGGVQPVLLHSVDADRGVTILSHRARGYENFPLVNLLEERLDIPIVIENDARAAATALRFAVSARRRSVSSIRISG